jgi:hypothetical protein
LNRAILLFVGLALGGCLARDKSAAPPAQLSLFNLVKMAEEGQPYLDSPNPATRVPMSAVVTPPSDPFFFRSPPFTASPSSNTGSKPVLNLLAGLVEGRFAPYVTIELWTNDYGPVWYNPTYFMVRDDGTGAPLMDPVQHRPIPFTLPVWTVAPPDRFYSPFWSSYYVLVPDKDVSKITLHPPKSTGEVLNLNYKMVDGPFGTWSVVPQVDVDPALKATRASPTDGMPAWMKVIAKAEYSDTSLAKMSTLGVGPAGAFYEGHTVDTLFVGLNDFQTLPNYVVKPIPIFVWFNRDANGALEPAQLPSVMGHGTLYANETVVLPGGAPNWNTYWEVYQVVRPPSAQPFYPVVANPDAPEDTDVFANARASHSAPTPSAEVSAIPNVARYAGRIALKPSCFTDAAPPAPTDASAPSQAVTWAQTCRFLDSQAALEANLAQTSIIDSKVAALCPLMLWAPVQP